MPQSQDARPSRCHKEQKSLSMVHLLPTKIIQITSIISLDKFNFNYNDVIRFGHMIRQGLGHLFFSTNEDDAITQCCCNQGPFGDQART